VTDASDEAVATIPASAKCASYFPSVGHDCSVFRRCTSGQARAQEQAFDRIVATFEIELNVFKCNQRKDGERLSRQNWRCLCLACRGRRLRFLAPGGPLRVS
jgi:hypothetical protein